MDDIQRKLAQIDDEFAGRNKLAELLSTAPLLTAATGLIAGITIHYHLSLPLVFWISLILLAAILAVAAYALKPLNRYCPAILTLSAILTFTVLGSARLHHYKTLPPTDISHYIQNEPVLAEIKGTIISQPVIYNNDDWQFARFSHSDPTTGLLLKLIAVKSRNSWQKTTGTIRVYISEPVLDLETSDSITALCWLEPITGPTNPGQFDTAKYLAQKNIHIRASINSRQAITKLPKPQNPAPAIITSFRNWVTNALITDTSPADQSRSVTEALLLGNRSHIDSQTYNAFRKTGLLHFISLSGLHVGILIAALWWFGKIAGLSTRIRALFAIAFIALFLTVVPPRPPTIRAAVIAITFCLAHLFRRRPNPFNTLALAALILLLARPTQIFEPGWQLSFASVAGILTFQPTIQYHLLRISTPLRYAIPQKILRSLLTAAITLLSVGFSAWIAGLGIILYHFHTITPLTTIWTVFTFPLVALILPLGLLKILIAAPFPTLAALLTPAITTLSNTLVALTKLFAAVDLSEIVLGKLPAIIIIFYYLTIAIILLAHSLPARKKLITPAAIAPSLIIAAFFLTRPNNSLTLTVLDVAHGQAAILQLPNNQTLLFDAGSLYTPDVGNRIIVPFLRHAGIRRLHTLTISHNDTDHINAIPEVLQSIPARQVCVNRLFLENDSWNTASFLRDTLQKRNSPLTLQPDQISACPDCRISTLWPKPQTPADTPDNLASTVTLITYAGKNILIPSDIEQSTQEKLLDLYPNLKADILILPHHGSARTLSLAFIESLNPAILIASCGHRQYQTQSIYNPPDRQTFVTPRHGAITVTVSPQSQITTQTFKK